MLGILRDKPVDCRRFLGKTINHRKLSGKEVRFPGNFQEASYATVKYACVTPNIPG